MTDNDIIKALECCKTGACLSCPKWKNEYVAGECNDILHFALGLINRQKAEIEELKKGFEVWRDIAHRETQYVSIAKAEAIKEFAERLKESAFECDVSFGYGHEHYTEAVAVVKIDNLLKELTGDNQ